MQVFEKIIAELKLYKPTMGEAKISEKLVLNCNIKHFNDILYSFEIKTFRQPVSSIKLQQVKCNKLEWGFIDWSNDAISALSGNISSSQWVEYFVGESQGLS